jgi:predicted HNH restriction endonuclease
MSMNTVSEREFIRRVATTTGIVQREIQSLVDAMVLTIEETVERGEDVTLTGFGTFERRKQGNQYAIGFRASQVLKDAVRGLYDDTHIDSLADTAHPVDEPDEVERSMTEGAARQVTSNRYERSRVARAGCLAVHGYSCAVCGFNFQQRYGAIGQGYIHVHHLSPMSTARGEREINPVTDLCPVCPNCHAMLHQRNPPYTIDELRAQLRLDTSRTS